MYHQYHITEYQILTGKEPIELSTKVEKAIHNGWQPFGSLAVNNSTVDSGVDASTYVQAVIKFMIR